MIGYGFVFAKNGLHKLFEFRLKPKAKFFFHFEMFLFFLIFRGNCNGTGMKESL